MKRKLRIIGISFVAIVAIYSIVWYLCIYTPIMKYENGFKEIGDSGKKIYLDDEDYSYSVRTPFYTDIQSNLSISNEELTEGLLVWVGFRGKVRNVGVILTDDGKQYQIEMKDKDTPKYSEYTKMIEENREVVEKLYNKANDIWNLDLE